MGKSASVAAVTALAILAATFSAPRVDAALRVRNALKEGTVAVSNLPGCCSSCVPTKGLRLCPLVCMSCPALAVANGTEATVSEQVGPYPLRSLTVRVRGKGFDVQQGEKFTSTAVFVVGPGTECGVDKSGVEAFIVEAGNNTVTASICLTY